MTFHDLRSSTDIKFDADLPPGREKALAITKLEEAMFWANAAIARAATETHGNLDDPHKRPTQ